MNPTPSHDISSPPVAGEVVAPPPVRSLYVHVPFCAHRCGYCDFVTTSAQPEIHARYVAGLRREHELRGLWEETAAGAAPDEGGGYDTVFVGGGTPTLLVPEAMDALLEWIDELTRPGAEVTLECNPETVTPQLARQLVDGGVSRVSLGAQSFSPAVLATLERRATPEIVRGAVHELRDAGIGRLSLDLIWGVPGQGVEDLARDLDAALGLEPDHLSAYELEFKPGTRLTRAHGTKEEAVGDASDEHYDLVVDRLQDAGWWWYEVANFARVTEERCRHNLAYWTAAPHHGVGVGAFGTDAAGVRRTGLPNVPRWLSAVEAGQLPPSREERLSEHDQRLERIMLALRLDEPCRIERADFDEAVADPAGLERIVELGLGTVEEPPGQSGAVDLRLARRGRMLLGGVLELLLLLEGERPEESGSNSVRRET